MAETRMNPLESSPGLSPDVPKSWDLTPALWILIVPYIEKAEQICTVLLLWGWIKHFEDYSSNKLSPETHSEPVLYEEDVLPEISLGCGFVYLSVIVCFTFSLSLFSFLNHINKNSFFKIHSYKNIHLHKWVIMVINNVKISKELWCRFTKSQPCGDGVWFA